MGQIVNGSLIWNYKTKETPKTGPKTFTVVFNLSSPIPSTLLYLKLRNPALIIINLESLKEFK